MSDYAHQIMSENQEVCLVSTYETSTPPSKSDLQQYKCYACIGEQKYLLEDIGYEFWIKESYYTSPDCESVLYYSSIEYYEVVEYQT